MSDQINDQNQDMVTHTSSASAQGVAADEAPELGSSHAHSPDGTGEEPLSQTDEDAALLNDADEQSEAEQVTVVGELRLVGILSPLNAVMGYYLDNPHEGVFHNVQANSNIAVGAVLAQGDAHLMRELDLPRHAGFVFLVPSDTVGPEIREVPLPLGFRRCFIGLRPAGTVDPTRAVRDRDQGPQELVRDAEAAWSTWLAEHVTLPSSDRPIGIVAWLGLPYCIDGLDEEILQELESDVLGLD